MLSEYPWIYPYFHKSEKTIYWPNGSITEFSYLQNPLDVFNYQGREYEDISLDEVTEHDEDTFKILRSSNRTINPKIQPTMFLTGNPGGIGNNWVKRMFVDRDFSGEEDPEDFAFIQAFVTDNKILLNADPNYIKRLQSLPMAKRKAYLEGDWNQFEGQFFEEWRPLSHVHKPFPMSKQLPLYGALDWGYAAPFCFLLGALQHCNYQGHNFNRLWVFKELYGTKRDPEEWGIEISRSVNWEQVKRISADPSIFPKDGDDNSYTRSIERDIKKGFGENGNKLQKATNARNSGWALLHQWLSMAPDGRPYLIVTSNCTNLIRTLPEMLFDKNDPEDIDTHLEDHAADTLRYLVQHVTFVDGATVTRPYNPFISSLLKAPPPTLDLTQFENDSIRKTKSWKGL